MAIVGFIVFGLFVGFVARLIAPGRHPIGLLMTLALGIAGSLIGGLVANRLGTGDVLELNLLGSIVAIASAAVLLALVSSGAGRRPARR